jgi:hypothetical protein
MIRSSFAALSEGNILVSLNENDQKTGLPHQKT